MSAYVFPAVPQIICKDSRQAKALYPNSTLADIYGESSMPFYPKLVKAHKELDRSVMKLYGFTAQNTPPEAACVVALMELYQKLPNKNN